MTSRLAAMFSLVDLAARESLSFAGGVAVAEICRVTDPGFLLVALLAAMGSVVVVAFGRCGMLGDLSFRWSRCGKDWRVQSGGVRRK